MTFNFEILQTIRKILMIDQCQRLCSRQIRSGTGTSGALLDSSLRATTIYWRLSKQVMVMTLTDLLSGESHCLL